MSKTLVVILLILHIVSNLTPRVLRGQILAFAVLGMLR
jgi:hypothetical protein